MSGLRSHPLESLDSVRVLCRKLLSSLKYLELEATNAYRDFYKSPCAAVEEIWNRMEKVL